MSKLVGDEAVGWNPFLKSLIDLSGKLQELGIVYADGETIYINEAEYV